MTPGEFLRQVERGTLAAAYLFLGPESYRRGQCRRALLEKVLTPEEREEGFTRLDLEETSLAEVLDDARSMSLFAPRRLIYATGGEAALPRGKAAAAEDEDGGKQADAAADLAAYLRDPNPGVTLVIEASRYEFEGEDKTRQERVRKFYAVIPAVVEFMRFSDAEARQLALDLSAQAGLKLGQAELALLVESTGGDASRIATEVEKLALYCCERGRATVEEITALVPNAREATVFALVGALARRDRRASLDVLDTLVREGEYLPLVLTFLGGLFRLALVAKEQNLRSTQDIQNYFQRQGTAMWRSRAEQVRETGSRFDAGKLAAAIDLCFRADKSLKGTRPDDRTVLEDFVFRLTA
jgi:DNA polymerase-3 subunit delta